MPTESLDPRERARIAVLRALPRRHRGQEFSAVLAGAHVADPELDEGVLRRMIWALLDEGELQLTVQQRLARH